MKQSVLVLILTVLMILPGLSACGTDPGTAGSDNLSAGEDSPVQASDYYAAVSMNRFKTVSADLGDAVDLTEDYGFDACTVSGADGTNYIYMYLTSADMAKELITDGDGDGEQDPGLEILKTGANYEYYRENYTNDTTEASVCGYYLRVDNMLILAAGSLLDEETVREDAAALFRSLGYDGL